MPEWVVELWDRVLRGWHHLDGMWHWFFGHGLLRKILFGLICLGILLAWTQVIDRKELTKFNRLEPGQRQKVVMSVLSALLGREAHL
jgi:hypothetical protein